MSAPEPEAPLDFIRQIVRDDLASGKHAQVVTRFPPQPNGFLHIGHAYAICLSFGIAEEFGGRYHLRFDDTNPSKEKTEYVESIQRDARWLGFDWGEHLYFASGYFEQLYAYAVQLIEAGKAYVCDLSAEEIREYRGTLTEPGRDSPYRDRPVEENLDLFGRMRAGEFDEGSRGLRARIDMASPNIVMRDPALYRIQKATHHRTGDAWCIYPLYDFTHCISDSIEGITHSLCTLEFENNRALYDWNLDQLGIYHPQQIEFGAVGFDYTLMSKRRMIALVEEGHVSGWDDPRFWTLSGMRRRGYPPAAIREFCKRVGVTRREKRVELKALEHAVREELNRTSPRAMAVLDPLRVVIENYPEGQTEDMEAVNNPEDPSAGTRKVPFSRVVYIEREDFREDPPRKFFRMAPGREVRLRYAYLVVCTGAIKAENGEVVELRCTYDPATKGGDAPDGRKVKGTLHWVSAEHAVDARVRLLEPLFLTRDPEENGDFRDDLNPESLVVRDGCKLEPGLADPPPGTRVQFERQGYFCAEPDSAPGRPVWNRTVPLRDSWAKIEKQQSQQAKARR